MASYAPGSPDWWLQRLGRALTDAQPRYDFLWRWYTGDPPPPRGYKRFQPLMKYLQKIARSNYLSLVVDSPIERMSIEGFRLRGATETDEWLGDAWEASELDLGALQAHREAAIFGCAYVMVSPGDEEDEQQNPSTGAMERKPTPTPKPKSAPGEVKIPSVANPNPQPDPEPAPTTNKPFPIVTIEDPYTTFVEMDPARPGKPLAAIRRWVDEVEQVAITEIYYQDQMYVYEAPARTILELSRDLVNGTNQHRVNDPSTWKLTESGPAPLGEVPVTRLIWRPTRGDLSIGEMESGNLFTIANRINETILDRLIIQKASAYKQRYATGVKPKSGKNGKEPPFDPGADILWVTENSDAKFGEFTESDIRQVLDAVRNDVQDLAAISKTPPHYLIGEIVNASGDALKAAETGLVSKTWDRMHTVEVGWKRVARLMLKAAELPSDGRIEVDWADPESRSKAELADAALKESTIGVPFSLLLEKLGYTPEQIKQAIQERDQEETRKLMMDAQRAATMAQFQPDPAAGPEKPGQPPKPGGPGGGGGKSGSGASVRPAKGQAGPAQQKQKKPPR